MKIKLPILLTLTLAFTFEARATSSSWNLDPTNGDWNTTTNWTPASVPNGPLDRATFGISHNTIISLSTSVEVNSITFPSGGSVYHFSTSQPAGLTISGDGVVNNSRAEQIFSSEPLTNGFFPRSIIFTNSASAGSQVGYENMGGDTGFTSGGGVEFDDHSTAGEASFTNFPGTAARGPGSLIAFYDRSTAGNATFTNKGPTISAAYSTAVYFHDNSQAGEGVFTCEGSQVPLSQGGQVAFIDSSNAAHGTFTANGGHGEIGGGAISFEGNSNASRATLIAARGPTQGGQIVFLNDAIGDRAQVKLFGNGTLDISGTALTGISVGSIEGNGLVELGTKELTVGTNALDTFFGGLIEDGSAGSGGSLTKVGTGRLVLGNANIYTGGTTINNGGLVINNTSGSATGPGQVQVNAGIFGGNGTVAGPVIVGTGSGLGADLSPGRNVSKVGLLTIQDALTLNSDATYDCSIDTNSVTADSVGANGITISTGAQISLVAVGTNDLPVGTVFTLIANSSASPIAGTFVNLPDAGTLTVGSNTFEADYEGGDGNDLTLTVVP